MNDPPPLEAHGLGRSFGALVALHDFSLMIAPGQCVALIGANGSGKSTAVRTLAGTVATERSPLKSRTVVGSGSGNARLTVPTEDAPSRTG